MGEEHSSDASELAVFLAAHYNGRFLLAVSGQPVEPPYVVACHHFNRLGFQLKHWLDILYAVASQYPPTDLRFVLGEYEQIYYRNFRAKHSPKVYAMDKQLNKHRLTHYFNVDTLHTFCNRLLSGEIYMSEAVPPTTSDELVKVAVANNFQELVLDNPKDVFIIFYQPGCRLSQRMLPLFEEVAAILRRDGDDTHIDIVRMNTEANFVHSHYGTDRASPICTYIKAGDKQDTENYTSAPKTNVILQFVAENATHELKSYDRTGQAKRM